MKLKTTIDKNFTLFFLIIPLTWAATFIYLVPSFTANLDHVFFWALFSIPMVIGTTLVAIGLITGNVSRSQIDTIKNLLSGLLRKD